MKMSFKYVYTYYTVCYMNITKICIKCIISNTVFLFIYINWIINYVKIKKIFYTEYLII